MLKDGLAFARANVGISACLPGAARMFGVILVPLCIVIVVIIIVVVVVLAVSIIIITVSEIKVILKMMH